MKHNILLTYSYEKNSSVHQFTCKKINIMVYSSKVNKVCKDYIEINPRYQSK